MGGNRAPETLERAVRQSGLIADGSGGVALVSGGADSAGLAAGLAAVCSEDRLVGLHLNYGLREDSDRDQATCGELCEMLGIELIAEPVRLPDGNLQAAAREARYAAAESLRADRGLDWIATGHTRTDLAETVLYRLATSPGRRALLGLRPSRGAVVRPLLALSREQVRALAVEAGLPFRDDPTNAEPRYARNRIRNEVLPVLREIGRAVEAVIAETQAELAEEAEALEAIAEEALDAAGASGAVISAAALGGLHPGLRRIALRTLAERAAGRPVALGRERAAEIDRLARDPEGGVVELGGGIEARVEHGHVRFARAGTEPPPEAAALSLPGSCRFGGWQVRAELRPGPIGEPADADTAVLDPRALGDDLVVRSWRDGDRIRPLGLGGSKSLQDLFTDRRVPRSLRRALPVVTSKGGIAWIAGVAVSEEFAAPPDADPAAVLTAIVVAPPDA